MGKFIKYEIKGTYKFILGVLALVLVLITGFFIYMNHLAKTGEPSIIGGLFTGLGSMVLFGTAIVTFFYIVGSFKKELDEDRGYLTFTLPLTGNQIVGSKLIVALMWFLILGIVILVYNFIMVLIFNPMGIDMGSALVEGFRTASQIISFKDILIISILTGFSWVSTLILIYFSMTIGRITFRNKKIGGLWFVIFIVLGILLAAGQFAISSAIPYYINFDTFSIQKGAEIGNEIITQMDNGVMVEANTGIFVNNIAAGIFSIITTVGLFLGTGYLIEKRIDL